MSSEDLSDKCKAYFKDDYLDVENVCYYSVSKQVLDRDFKMGECRFMKGRYLLVEDGEVVYYCKCEYEVKE